MFTKKADKKTIKTIYGAVKEARPDLIVLTGDSVYPAFWVMGSNNRLQIEAVCNLFEAIEIPYAFIYGNHDADIWGNMRKDEISDYFEKQPYSLFQKNDGGLTGQGNYAVKFLDKSGDLNSAAFMFDTNSKN
jgi:metallophosphoesterase superfamily enzyme